MIYTIKQFSDKKFNDKQDLVRFIKENKADIFAKKLAEYKTKSKHQISKELFVNKFEPNIEDIQGNFIKVKAIINSTNVIDSHMDLHMKGTWNKTVSDKKTTVTLQSHKADFNYLLDAKSLHYNKEMQFNEIGVNSEMKFDANINEFIVSKKNNELMFNAYKNGDVTEHSVGMMYVWDKLDIAFYDEESQKEMDFFNEIRKHAVNPEVMDEYGYVWVVREALKREGSPVVFGSNSITPTLSVENYEPQKSTQNSNKEEPTQVTQTNKRKLSII